MKTELLRIELEKYDTWQAKNPNKITGSDYEIRERYLSEQPPSLSGAKEEMKSIKIKCANCGKELIVNPKSVPAVCPGCKEKDCIIQIPKK